MTNRSDDKRTSLLTLLGVTSGHVNDLEKAWLKSVVSSPTGDDINGLWYDLFVQEGATSSNWNDAADEFLTALGYTGALPDKWAQYWAAGGGGGGYEPGLMHYDGASYYDLGDTFTAVGDLVTGTIRFSRETFTGDTFEYLLRYSADSGEQRLGVIVLSSDYSADTTLQGKLLVQSRDASNTPLCRLINVDSIDVLDGGTYTIFYAFNGTTGEALLYIDGQDADKSDWTGRTLTTGTLPTGNELVMVGAIPGGGYFNGDIGYVSIADDYLTTPTDFYDPTDGLQEIDTTDWASSPWGAQPLVFADDGKLDTNNEGSTSAFTKNGTITGPS